VMTAANLPQAIVLAAGRGGRMGSVTQSIPKCMVELVGKSLLCRQLDTLRDAGVCDIAVVGGYCADALRADGAAIVLNPRHLVTNMVGSLFCAETLMVAGRDVIVSYGDIVYERRVLQTLLDTPGDVVVCVDRGWFRLWQARMPDPLLDAETLRLADGNRIIEIGMKPSSMADIEGQYIGLIKVSGAFVHNFREAWHGLRRRDVGGGEAIDGMYMTSFIQHLIDEGHDVRAALFEGGWLEVDTAADLEAYRRLHHSGELDALMRLR
jgi:choline kinase